MRDDDPWWKKAGLMLLALPIVLVCSLIVWGLWYFVMSGEFMKLFGE